MPDSQSWTQRVGAFTALPEILCELGGNARATVESAGLTLEDLQDADRRVPFAAIGRLLHEAAVRTRTPHFGLLAGRAWHLDDLGALGTIMRNSATVREALQALVSQQFRNSEGGAAFVLGSADVVDLGYAICHGGTVGVTQLYDAVLSAAVNFMCELCGPGWKPTEVLLSHSAPDDGRHYRARFRAHPRFDAEYSALRFPASWLDCPIAGADGERKRLAEERVATIGPGIVQRVYRTVRVQLLQGSCSGDKVALAMGVHRRTLNRRLQEQGTTFRACLDAVRFEVACQLLVDSHVSLDDLAATLGYASVSPFMRTFRRWTGTTPGQWRRSAGTCARRAYRVMQDAPGTRAAAELVQD